jgi:hypothetical protein
MTKKPNIIELTFKEVTTRNGLFCQFDDQHGVLLLDVKSPFTEDDFVNIGNIIDPYFLAHGELKGIIINSKKFPYWSSPYNRQEYVNFAKNNHHKFQKAALGIGGVFVHIIAKIARGRVHPTVKVFKYNKIDKAQDWILLS